MEVYFQLWIICTSFELDRRWIKLGFFHSYLEMIVLQVMLQVFMLTLPPNVRNFNLLVGKGKLIRFYYPLWCVTIPSSGSTTVMYGFFSGTTSLKNGSELPVESNLKFLIPYWSGSSS